MPGLVDPNLEILESAAEALGPLIDELTLVGGASAGLLITDPAARGVRPTIDVDWVVEASTYAKYGVFGRRLSERGFQPGQNVGDPMCRWRRGAIVIDIMPLDESVLGFSNRWYKSALLHPLTSRLRNGVELKHVDGPHFVATKLEAFRSRGDGDFVGSHDIEDLTRVVDGRREIEDEFARAPRELTAFVAGALRSCLADRFFVEALPGYFGGGIDGNARGRIAMRRLERLCGERESRPDA